MHLPKSYPLQNVDVVVDLDVVVNGWPMALITPRIFPERVMWRRMGSSVAGKSKSTSRTTTTTTLSEDTRVGNPPTRYADKRDGCPRILTSSLHNRMGVLARRARNLEPIHSGYINLGKVVVISGYVKHHKALGF